MSGYEDLTIYQLALEGVVKIHALFRQTILRNDFVLKDQLYRASISVVANIAEGYGRHTLKDRSYFLSIVIGSVNEVKALLDVTSKLYSFDVLLLKGHYSSLGKQVWSYRQKINRLEK